MKTDAQSRSRRRVYYLVSLCAVALVILPFWFWYDTWFGRDLSETQIEKFLTDAGKPRRIQQALAQVGERMGRGDESVRRWYPKVTELASHPSAELRQTVAWLMGQDRGYQPFHSALLRMIGDPEPMVRRNAALALAALRDPAARSELLLMLQPYTLSAPKAGKATLRLKIGDYVNPGTLVLRVDDEEVRSPVPGELRVLLAKENTAVAQGEPLAEIAPDETHVWEALRALYLVGEPEDSEEIQRVARGAGGLSVKVQQQARLTLRQIQDRQRGQTSP